MMNYSPESLSCLMNNHKIINIELIELPENEEFYDLTVDSKYPNFALGAGVFIHNSGIANVKEDEEGTVTDMKQSDIIGDLTTANNRNISGLTMILRPLYRLTVRARVQPRLVFRVILPWIMPQTGDQLLPTGL